MLQNRVDPFGRFITTPARGLWMGNRGVIHEGDQIVKPFKHKAWITCALEFKGRKRKIMTADRWTELFFMDEATAFAAGHRPCFECRRADARRFKAYWIEGNPSCHFTLDTSITRIDDVLHRERIDSGNGKVLHERTGSDIPNGTFILMDNDPYLFCDGRLYRWTPFGYEESIGIGANTRLTIITPMSIVNAFSAGYEPQMSLTFDKEI